MTRLLFTAGMAAMMCCSTLMADDCPSSRRRILTWPTRPTLSTRSVLPTRSSFYVTPPVRSYTVARPQYTFGACEHLQEFSVGLYDQANAICWELHRQYRHNPGFETVYAEMYAILQDTKHIQQLVDASQRAPRRGDNDHIATDLHHMDALFRHVAAQTALWRPRYYRAEQNRLALLTHQFDDTLHNMMIDYGVNSRIGAEAPVPAGQLLREAPLPNLNSGGTFQNNVLPGNTLPGPQVPGPVLNTPGVRSPADSTVPVPTFGTDFRGASFLRTRN